MPFLSSYWQGTFHLNYGHHLYVKLCKVNAPVELSVKTANKRQRNHRREHDDVYTYIHICIPLPFQLQKLDPFIIINTYVGRYI